MSYIYRSRFFVFPSDCNHSAEIIFGGKLMSEMDLAAAHAVSGLLRDDATLALGVESAVTHKASFEFVAPSYCGDELEIIASAEFGENKSVKIEVVAIIFNGKRLKPLAKALVLEDIKDKIVAKASFVFITTSAYTGKYNMLNYKNHHDV